jgi:hypothetical protein
VELDLAFVVNEIGLTESAIKDAHAKSYAHARISP